MDCDINININITIAKVFIYIILISRVKISLVNADGCMVSVTHFLMTIREALKNYVADFVR